MNRGTQIALIVGLFVLAGAVYLLRAGSVNDVNRTREYNTRLQCLDCKHEFNAELDVADVGPFKCEKCGKQEAWQMWECGKCQATFTPPPDGSSGRQPVMPKCPKCGGSMTGRLSIE